MQGFTSPPLPAYAPHLTDREMQVLELLAQGMNSGQVATALSISRRTAETHRAHVLAKFGAHTTVVLVRLAIRYGVIKP